MKALTLWPEWAHAICHLGKIVENRTWKPPKSIIGDRIAIHAGKYIGGKNTKSEVFIFDALNKVASMASSAGFNIINGPGYSIGLEHEDFSHLLDRKNIVTGSIVATAKIEGYCFNSNQPWAARGQYQWNLSETRLVTPYQCSGKQGLWNIPTHLSGFAKFDSFQILEK